MKRRMVEITIFLLAGLSLADLVMRMTKHEPGPVCLVRNTPGVRVFAKDSLVLTDLAGNPAVRLYRANGVVYLEEPFDIDSGRIRVRLYAWIWSEHVFDLGSAWLVLCDENLRVCNNCVKIGQVMKGTRLQKVWSPPGRLWHLVRLDGRIPVRSMLALSEIKFFPFLKNPWPAVFLTTLTPTGAQHQPRRSLGPNPKLDLAWSMFTFAGICWLAGAYLKRFRRFRQRDRVKSVLIIGAAFAAGIALRILI